MRRKWGRVSSSRQQRGQREDSAWPMRNRKAVSRVEWLFERILESSDRHLLDKSASLADGGGISLSKMLLRMAFLRGVTMAWCVESHEIERGMWAPDWSIEAACFARRSAESFPWRSEYPGTHCREHRKVEGGVQRECSRVHVVWRVFRVVRQDWESVSRSEEAVHERI